MNLTRALTRGSILVVLTLVSGCTVMQFLPWDRIPQCESGEWTCPDMKWEDLVKPCEKDADCEEGYYCSQTTCLPGYPEQPDANIIIEDLDAGALPDAAPGADGG